MATPESKFVISAENRASSVIQRVQSDMAGLGSSAMSVASRFASFGATVPLALAAMGAAFVASVKGVTDLQDGMGKLAQRTGIGVSALSELNYAAKLSDVSTDELAHGVSRLTAKMADVAQGSKAAAGIFESLGVKVKNSDGSLRSADEVLKDIAQRFSEFPDGPEKSAFAIEIFGRAGAKLVPLLNQGRAGLADAADEARRFGIVIDEKAAKAAERFNDDLTRLAQAGEGLKIGLFTPVIAALADVTTGFLAARQAGLGFFNSLGTDKDTITGQVEFYERRLARLQGELDKGGRDVYGRPVDTTLLDTQIAETTGHLEKLRRLQLTLVGIGEPPGLAAPGATPRLRGASGKDMGDGKFSDPLAKLIETGELSDAARLDQILDTEERVRELLGKLTIDGMEQERLAIISETEANRNRADAWRDLIDPVSKYVRQLEEIRRLVGIGPNAGGLTAEQGFAAEFDVQSKMQDDVLKPMTAETKSASDAAKELGFTFSSAFEDAILGGKKLSDVLTGLSQDIGRVFLRKMVTEPLAAEAVALVKSLSLGDLTRLPTHADGLDYVPYDGYVAQLHRGERVLTAAEARQSGGAAPVHFESHFHVNGDMSRSQEARLAVMVRNIAEATIANRARRMLT